MCAFTLKYFQHTRLPTSMMFCDGCGFLILEETSIDSDHMVSSDDIQHDTEREDRRTGTLVIPCFESNQKHPRTINELMVWPPKGCGSHLKHDQQIRGSGETGGGQMCKWLANRVKEISKNDADER